MLFQSRVSGYALNTDGFPMSRNPSMAPRETRNVVHCPGLPGLTFAEARRSSSPWRVYNYQYAFCVPSTWAASVLLDRQQSDLGPGNGLFTMPGQVHWTPKVKQQGDLRVLLIDESVFHQLAREDGTSTKHVYWKRGFAQPSSALVTALNEIFRGVYDHSDPMLLQTVLVDFFRLLAREQLLGPRSEPNLGPRSAATRMRELIHHSPTGFTLDLSELASAVGLSRFQALRTFKRHYGIPPHAYQLSVRAAAARYLLEQGESPTQVAHTTGFVDQSHMTHYFKRMFGVTPGFFARSAARALFPQVSGPPHHADGVLWSFSPAK